ncbi:MAG: hypothetical protein CMH81_00890 [Nitrospiraceae bacterium]|nr:hypothetical protein [Nitrospiraceae bacterium]|tara:strand:+ start:1681 stop:2724 length:1044 start_codon:yes stop_codon:yes gene_type:complete
MEEDTISHQQDRALSSSELVESINAIDFSDREATVIGYGGMGKEYVKALRSLGVRRIRVCSRSKGSLPDLHGTEDIETVVGGVEKLRCSPRPNELGIVCTPMESLVNVADLLVALGFRHLLIEKPISLYASEITQLAERMTRSKVRALCAYNRVAYPGVQEVRARASSEGGITSCSYTFTEMIKSNWSQRFQKSELARWGIANSLHVISMAHALIGAPQEWSGHRSSSLEWHPSGAVFTGSGVSDQDIVFGYHADWGSKSRWSVEAHTPVASYRLCPLETVLRKESSVAQWENIPISTYAPEVKMGIVEQVAAMLSSEISHYIPLVSLSHAAILTAYAEKVFGYPTQ